MQVQEKTTVLKAIKELANKQGYTVIGLTHGLIFLLTTAAIHAGSKAKTVVVK